MAELKDILYKVSLVEVTGTTNIEIASVHFDSRQVSEGSLFVAVKGTQVDGHQYIGAAIEKGAIAIVCQEKPEQLNDGVTYIKVEKSDKALGIIVSNFYGNPSKKLQVVAVTGTNGKTTTVTLLHKLFMELGYNVGMMSTVTNKINDEVLPATHTTPDALAMNELFQLMVKKGCTHCFMEASSHAIDQERMAGVTLAGAVFTNISHDHLDYHLTFDEYIRVKKRLFDELPSSAFSLVNVDDKRGLVMLQNTKASKNTYALKTMCDFKAKVLSNTIHGLELDIDQKTVWFKLIGDFNAYNVLGVYATAMLLNEKSDEVLTILSELQAAPGRFEQVTNKANVTAIVDYAHTPDALENVLSTINVLRTGNEKVITVVGCGGNRDKAKRPVMAEIACRFSDRVLLTSDNPRNEEPEAIIEDMKKGVSPSNFKKAIAITDRKEAIKLACSLAEAGDIILVAGKGHETYQEIKGVKYDFDDRKVLREMLE